MKIKVKDFRQLAESLLFENSINEISYSPEYDSTISDKNSAKGKNSHGPMINGDGEYQKSWEEDIDDRPIRPSEVMPIVSTERIDHDYLDDEEYEPEGFDELMKSSNTILIQHKNDINSKKAKMVWKNLKKIIQKVKES